MAKNSQPQPPYPPHQKKYFEEEGKHCDVYFTSQTSLLLVFFFSKWKIDPKKKHNKYCNVIFHWKKWKSKATLKWSGEFTNQYIMRPNYSKFSYIQYIYIQTYIHTCKLKLFLLFYLLITSIHSYQSDSENKPNIFSLFTKQAL